MSDASIVTCKVTSIAATAEASPRRPRAELALEQDNVAPNWSRRLEALTRRWAACQLLYDRGRRYHSRPHRHRHRKRHGAL